MMKLYTAKEVADILKVNVQTVFKWLREGKIESYKVQSQYRISEEQLQKILKEGD